MFDVTSETRDDTSVITLKSRLTLQIILPARVTPSLIDNKTKPKQTFDVPSVMFINFMCD